MNTSLSNNLHERAAQLQVNGLKLQDEYPSREAFKDNIAKDLPIDMPPYIRETMIEFSGEYGVYPPVLVIVDDEEAREKLRDMLDEHSLKYGKYKATAALSEHHELIENRLEEEASLNSIAKEVNCGLNTLRSYCRDKGLIT